MENNNNIIIAYTPNNDTFYYTMVSMESVIINNASNSIIFIILIDKSFKNENIKYFNNFMKYDNCIKVEVLHINNSLYQPLMNLNNAILPNMLYKLELPSLCNYNKILYLLDYTFILGDFQCFFNCRANILENIFSHSFCDCE